MASYNQTKKQGYNSGAGKYTANGFIPSRASKSNTSNNSGCFSVLILFILSMSAFAYGVIAII